MNIDDLGDLYRAKTDEELLHLASETGQLTAEAQSILKAELSKRRIEVPSGGFLQTRETESQFLVSHQPVAKIQSVREFIPAVLQLHRKHIWLFAKVTAPPVILTTAAWFIGRYEVHEMVRQASRGGDSMLRHQRLLVEALLLGLTKGLVSWYA